MMNHYRTNDYRTPRSLNEAFGPYATFRSKPQKNTPLAWLAAFSLVVAMVLIACWRG